MVAVDCQAVSLFLSFHRGPFARDGSIWILCFFLLEFAVVQGGGQADGQVDRVTVVPGSAIAHLVTVALAVESTTSAHLGAGPGGYHVRGTVSVSLNKEPVYLVNN